MSKYNFGENILKLSETQDIKDLPNEWEFITRFEGNEKNKLCVCNCKIKNYTFFINIKNKSIILCGDSCKNKLQLKESNENLIKRLYLKNIFKKQEYGIIKDIFKYSNDVLFSFINNLKLLDSKQLYDIRMIIDYLIDNNDYFNFEAKYHKLLQESVNRIELIKTEDERLKQEIILEQERYKQIILKQVRLKQERLEQERLKQRNKFERLKNKITCKLKERFFIIFKNIIKQHLFLKKYNSNIFSKYQKILLQMFQHHEDNKKVRINDKELNKIIDILVSYYANFITNFKSDECNFVNSFYEKYNKKFYHLDELIEIYNKKLSI